MDVIVLWLGWLLTWTFGTAVLAALPGRRPALEAPGELPFVIGTGFLVGQFLLTVWMRLLSIAGVAFGITVIAAPLAAVTALSAWIAWRRNGHALSLAGRSALGALTGAGLQRPLRLIWLALLAWLALRFALLLIDVSWRPLYPWDAWAQWATKARVWFELKTMVPFGTAAAWMNAPVGSVYFNPTPHYPATVPLTQVWSALLIGRWDDALVNLPWWLTAVAFGIALYGFLRLSGFRELYALLGTWLVLSLPILDTHVALAGYADLAMSAYFTLTALTALRYVRTRAVADLVLALLLAAACVVIKNPGKIWLAMLVPGLVTAFLPRHGLRVAAAWFGIAAMAALVLTHAGITLLGYHLRLEFDMPWNGLAQAYFAFANWHLLFYGALAVAVVGWRQLLSRELAPLTLIVAAGFAFLMFGFAFTNARLWVEDQSTVNRATLHLAPLIVVWMLTTFRAWALAQAPDAPASEAALPAGPLPS
jgi:hypothetical protein